MEEELDVSTDAKVHLARREPFAPLGRVGEIVPNALDRPRQETLHPDGSRFGDDAILAHRLLLLVGFSGLRSSRSRSSSRMVQKRS